MSLRFIIALILFFAPLSSVVCQSNQDVIEALNVRYERFKNDVARYGKDSPIVVDSFLDMENFFNSISSETTPEKRTAYHMLAFLNRWETILSDINDMYGRDFFLILQNAHVENNERATMKKYPYSEMDLESMYDGGKAIREEYVAEKADLYLSLRYNYARQYAILHDVDSVYDIVREWIREWDQYEWKECYLSDDNYHKCVLLFSKWLSSDLLAEGLGHYGIGIIGSILDYLSPGIDDYLNRDSLSGNMKECIEDLQTYYISLVSTYDSDYALLMSNIRTQLSGFSRTYDINNYLILVSIYASIEVDSDPDSSLKALIKAVNIIQSNRVGHNGRVASRESMAFVYNELGQVYTRMQLYKEALSAQEKVVELDGDNLVPAHINNLAFLYSSNGMHEKAINTFHILEDNGELPTQSYYNLAFCYHVLKEYDKATEFGDRFYNSALLEFFEQMKYLPPWLREEYLSRSNVEFFYDGMTALAIDNPQGVGLAYNASLFLKGLLVRMNAITRRKIADSGNEELKSAYYSYLKNIASRDQDRLNNAKQSFMSLIPQNLDLLISDYSVEWEDVWQELRDSEVAIEFVEYSDYLREEMRLAALIIGKDYDQPKMVDLCSYNEFRDLFKASDGYGCPRIYNQLEKPSQLLWGPLMEYLSGIKTVYYSPCIGLSQINLDILTAGAGNKPMNQVFNMRRMLSTAGLVDRKTEEKLETAYLVGGVDYGSAALATVSNAESFRGFNNKTGWDPLGTMCEVESIQKSCHKKMKVSMLTGANAEESALKKQLVKSPSILHIATHGFYMEEKLAHKYAFYSEYEGKWIPDGLRSGVILSGSNDVWLGKRKSGGNDGTLTADEINGLDLSGTELVVLSACQTGLGEYNAEGTYGLMRAFKNAGAGSIVMSLWEVNDEATTLFMTTFYSRLVSGKDRYEAFLNAQEAVKKKYPSPNCWAAFVMLD